MKPIILDGARLARARAAALASRGRLVHGRRGRAPTLALLAFADPRGEAPWVGRKGRACEAAEVEVVQEILPAGTDTAAALEALDRLLAAPRPDAVFVEFPFPSGVDEARVVSAIPPELDVDLMTPGAFRRYLDEPAAHPPLTVSAGLALLDEGGVELPSRQGLVVGPDIPFNRMFREALIRRGVHMPAVLDPDAVDLEPRVAAADLVVLSAGRAGVVRSGWLRPGAVVVDAGYFNPGGRGDLELADGTEHLEALAPVPGGVGPMTVSMLVERVVEMAEGVSSGR